MMDVQASITSIDDLARQYADMPAGPSGATESVIVEERATSSRMASEGVDALSPQDQLSALLEANSAMIRRNVMDFYQRLKAQMAAEQRQAVDAERAVANRRLQAKQEELELLQRELAAHRDALEASEATVLRSCALVAALNERWRGRRYLRHYFVTWVTHIRDAKRMAKLEARAVAMHNVEFLQRKVLRAWSRRTSTDIKTKVKQRVRAAEESTRAGCEAEAAREMAALKQQLAEAQQALAAERMGKELLAQDMKRSFMRGVCALNMEAMQVMKRGVEPGGMNSNPTIFRIPPSEDGEPQPEAIPASIQNMMSALNMSGPVDLSVRSGAGIRPQVLRHGGPGARVATAAVQQ